MTEEQRLMENTTLMIAQLWVLSRIRDMPGETHEEITKAVAIQFKDELEVTPLLTATWMKVYQETGFIYHDTNADGQPVWLFKEPNPTPRSGLRRVVIETPNSRLQGYTKGEPKTFAEALQRQEGVNDCVLMFDNIRGEPCIIVPAEHVYSLAFDDEEVPTALQ